MYTKAVREKLAGAEKYDEMAWISEKMTCRFIHRGYCRFRRTFWQYPLYFLLRHC